MQKKEKEKYMIYNARSDLLKETSLKKKKEKNINRYNTVRRYEKEYRTIVWQKNDEPYNTQNCLLIDDGSN